MPSPATTWLHVSGYRFLLRRIECALLFGDVCAATGALRARTTSLALGCVLAIVAAMGCAFVALLRPQSALGQAPIVMGRESGALYVRVDDVWHPVLNLASARLIAATNANPQPVSESELGHTKRGPLLGIPGAPQLLDQPLAGAESAWAICDSDNGGSTTVVVGPAEDSSAQVLTAEQMILVATESGSPTYLLYGGRRAVVDLADPAVVWALRLQGRVPHVVAQSLLNAVPEAPRITAPRIRGGGRASVGLPGFLVGGVVRITRASGDEYYVVLEDGVQRIGQVAADLLRFGDSQGSVNVPTVAPDVIRVAPIVNTLPVSAFPDRPPTPVDGLLGALLRDAEPAQAELAVPIGIVDRPFEQSRVPLTIDLSGAAGNVAVVGAPQTGKSTALRTLIMALAATHDAGRVQFYCLDFGGGALAQVDELPHVGAVAGRAQPQLASRMLAELESAVRFREAFFRDHGIDSVARYRQLRAKSAAESFADIFLVIDGWASLRQEFAALEESIVALAAQGLSFGVHVALSAARWAEIRPSLRDQIGSRIELRLADPADSELDRRQAQRVPVDRPGRGLSRDGMHMVIALPDLDGVALRRRSGDPVAPPIPLLPARVDYDSVVARAGDELGAHILLGLEERRGQPVAVDFGRHPHLLVLGDNECGKTAALRTLCREIVRTHTAARAQLLIVDFRHTLLDVIESEHMSGYVSSPAALGAKLSSLVDLLQARMPAPDVSQAQLRARSWWSGPDIYVVVDDYDLVAVSSGNPLMVLLEYLPHARDLGLHLVVARRSGGAARALFEPVLASLRDLGCRALLMSGRPDEGALFGSSRPMPLPPGRGILVTGAGDEQLVQVAWSPPP